MIMSFKWCKKLLVQFLYPQKGVGLVFGGTIWAVNSCSTEACSERIEKDFNEFFGELTLAPHRGALDF
jgi:hypothetical protein